MPETSYKRWCAHSASHAKSSNPHNEKYNTPKAIKYSTFTLLDFEGLCYSYETNRFIRATRIMCLPAHLLLWAKALLPNLLTIISCRCSAVLMQYCSTEHLNAHLLVLMLSWWFCYGLLCKPKGLQQARACKEVRKIVILKLCRIVRKIIMQKHLRSIKIVLMK